MSVLKSNFTTRIENYLQEEERRLSEVTFRTLNDISSEITSLGIKAFLKKHPEAKAALKGDE